MKKSILVSVDLDWDSYDTLDDMVLLHQAGVLDGLKKGVSVSTWVTASLNDEWPVETIN